MRLFYRIDFYVQCVSGAWDVGISTRAGGWHIGSIAFRHRL